MDERKLSLYIGSKIKHFRKKGKITQEELGKKIGVKNNTISAYERGAISTDQDVLFKLADALDISINDLFPDTVVSVNNHVINNYTYFPTAISAGLPLNIEAITNADKITLPDNVMGKYAGHKDIIVMRINGDSMNKIMPDESLIAVKPTTLDNLHNGDIVVFSENGEYSVKHYNRYGDALVFKPNSTNTKHKEQEYSVSDDITIHGKVVMYIVNLD